MKLVQLHNRTQVARRPWLLGAVLTTVGVALAGCSVEVGEPQDFVSDREDALTLYPDDDPFSSWSEVKDYKLVSASAVSDPAVCEKRGGYVIFYRNASNKIVSLTTDTSGAGSPSDPPGTPYRSSEWFTWPGRAQFDQKPACVSLDPVDGSGAKNYELVVAGRGQNGKFLATKPLVIPNVDDHGSEDLPNPGRNPWIKVSDQLYASAPAMSASAVKDLVVITGIGTDGRMYSHTRSWSDFDAGSWSNAIQAPQLPDGFAMSGSPTIAMTRGGVNLFTIVVRGTKRVRRRNQSKYFFAYFNGTSYSSRLPDKVWLPLSISGPSSDPALEFTEYTGAGWVPNVLTLAYRKGSNIYQTSGYDEGLGSDNLIHNRGGTFTGSPAIKGVIGEAEGEYFHTIIARKSNGTLYESFVERSDALGGLIP